MTDNANPNCPACGKQLKHVPTPGWMNEDQFDAIKPGDWFCECHNNGRGDAPFAYFWNREVIKPEEKASVVTDNARIVREYIYREGICAESYDSKCTCGFHKALDALTALETELATTKADLETMAAECRANDAAASHLQGLLDEAQADLARAREVLKRIADPNAAFGSVDCECYKIARAALAPEQKGCRP